jgi:hypothetical protein
MKSAVELAKIDHLEREYWAAWRDSKEPGEITSARPGRVTVKRVSRDGNPTFLDGVAWCIEQRCKIFGLYTPSKYTSAELDQMIEQELERMREEIRKEYVVN